MDHGIDIVVYAHCTLPNIDVITTNQCYVKNVKNVTNVAYISIIQDVYKLSN